MYLGRIVVLETVHDLPAAEGLVGRSKIGGGRTTTSAIPDPCSGHFHKILWLQDFAWRVYATVNPSQA